jgi:hypothetical protein
MRMVKSCICDGQLFTAGEVVCVEEDLSEFFKIVAFVGDRDVAVISSLITKELSLVPVSKLRIVHGYFIDSEGPEGEGVDDEEECDIEEEGVADRPYSFEDRLSCAEERISHIKGNWSRLVYDMNDLETRVNELSKICLDYKLLDRRINIQTERITQLSQIVVQLANDYRDFALTTSLKIVEFEGIIRDCSY